MGRPLKIKHDISGIVSNVDIGFNSFSSLTDPVIPGGMSASQFLGVVGGYNGSSDYPVVQCSANLYGTEDDAIIITQKGAIKYLVAQTTAVSVSTITAGRTYLISDIGTTTNWAAIGAGINPVPGDVFTATAVGSGDGDVLPAGVCVLANEAAGSVTDGNMQITITTGGSIVQASKLTNKYVWDYQNPPVRFAANFFVAGGTSSTTLANVAVTSTTGQFSCTASSFVPGDAVVVSGTLTGNATISGYTNPTTYYMIAANGTTTFQLSATPDGSAITTTAGTTTGLTFVIPQGITAKSGAEIDTWTNGTGNLDLAEVQDYTS